MTLVSDGSPDPPPLLKVSADLSSEGADMDKLSKEMDRLQNAIEAANGWELDRVLDRAMDALRCPDGEALVANLSGKDTSLVRARSGLLWPGLMGTCRSEEQIGSG